MPTQNELTLDHSSPVTFSYTPLRAARHEIRLLLLHPGLTADGISCSMTTTTLDQSIPYEALSYEWGLPCLDKFSISVDGKPIFIRENLWWALHYLRSEKDGRIMWIDALCINQEDTEERNAQVGQMGRIYSQASSVIAWVGRLTEQVVMSDVTAVSFINRLSKLSDRQPNTIVSVETKPFRTEWDAVWMFLGRRYWSRLWIVQEIVLASKLIVQYGSESFYWDDLEVIFARLSQYAPADRCVGIKRRIPFNLWLERKHYLSSRRSSLTQRQASTLVDLILQFGEAECCDERDRVFGVAELSRSCCREASKPDYSKTPLQIYFNVLVHHLNGHENRQSQTRLNEIVSEVAQSLRIHPNCDALATLNIVLLINGGRRGDQLRRHDRLAVNFGGNITIIGTSETPSQVDKMLKQLPVSPKVLIGQGGDSKVEASHFRNSLKLYLTASWSEDIMFFITDQNTFGCAIGNIQVGNRILRNKAADTVAICPEKRGPLRRCSCVSHREGVLFYDQDWKTWTTDKAWNISFADVLRILRQTA